MEVTVYGQLRAATDGKTVRLDAPAGGTVGDVLEAFLEAYPRAEPHVLDDDGRVRPSVRVMVDGEGADLDDECPPDASLRVFPAMQGG